MQINAPFWDSLVFAGIDDVEVQGVTAAFGTVEVLAKGHADGASCPDCGRFSGRVHDRYQRRLSDLPLADQGFVIRLTVRRFICESTGCPRRTFAEPFSRLAVPHARFNRALERVGLALAGRAGARLATHRRAAHPAPAGRRRGGAGRMTLLRRVVSPPDPQFSTPRVLGVDDFAIHRGQTYCTVLTSVEYRRVVDVLPTREAGPLAAWLDRHPGVEIICRDRAGAYAQGARRCAPDALRVADRFHLWQGLGRAVETCVAAHRDCLHTPTSRDTLPQNTPPASERSRNDTEPVGRRAERKKAAHALPRVTRSGLLPPGDRPAPGLGPQHRPPVRERRTLAGHLPRKPAPAQAESTPTSPISNDDAQRDAPASPNSTASWSSSKLPSPTAWSAPTSPPCAGLHPPHCRGRRRCGS
ncbi:ISL3 family transposase [Streptomyces violascens]|uniref:ISL3 family transposase n=1 Tax=Streptomyces violascens TaxID=67381 RepID=UPI0036539D9E